MKGTKNKTLLGRLKGRPEIPVLCATLGLSLIFTLFSQNFLSSYNIYNVSRTAALYVFVALSQTMVMLVGGMNVSLGYIGALAVVAVGHSLQNWGWSTGPAVLFALVVGVLCGLVNGLVITKLHINAFVSTLATQFIFKGLVNGISEGFPYTEIPTGFTTLGRGNLFGLPYMLFLAAATLVAVWYLFRFTTLGRRLLATGGNEKAAKMAAVDTDRMQLIANILSGLFAAVAGICTVSMNGAAQPTTGQDWMIYSFAVSVIGGTALAGGVICPVGIAIAAFLVVIIKNGLVMLNANIYFEQTYLGLILLGAVSIGSVSAMVSEVKRRQRFRREQAAGEKK